MNLDYSLRVNNGVAGGRLSGLSAIYSNVLNQNTATKLIGYGPDSIIGETNIDKSQYKYGVSSYIGVNGWSMALVSIGFLGAISITFFYLIISIHTYKFSKIITDPYWKSISFATFLISIVFFLDFFTYTRSFFNSIPLNITLLYFYGILYNKFHKH